MNPRRYKGKVYESQDIMQNYSKILVSTVAAFGFKTFLKRYYVYLNLMSDSLELKFQEFVSYVTWC